MVDYTFFREAGRLSPQPMTLVNIELPDQPLVYVNEGFCRLTGYPLEEILGKNCRFLQGKGTDPQDVKRVRDSISQSLAVCSDLLNYKKTGEPFYNRLVLLPITVDDVRHYIGMQLDSTALILGQLAENSNRTFDQVKISKNLEDKINNPLMTVRMLLYNDRQDEPTLEKVATAFDRIRQIVLAL